jgi:hypothetical protein
MEVVCSGKWIGLKSSARLLSLASPECIPTAYGQGLLL